MKTKFFSFIFMTVFLLNACSVFPNTTPEKTRKPSEDWGRGLPIGEELLGTAGMSVTSNDTTVHTIYPFWSVGKPEDVFVGTNSERRTKVSASQSVHFVLPFRPQVGKFGIRYVQLVYQDGEISIQNDHEVLRVEGQIGEPKLLIDNNQGLHLFWVNRPTQSAQWQLWYALLDNQGLIQGHAVQLSDAKTGIDEYNIVVDSVSGESFITWSEMEAEGIYLLRISPRQEISTPVKLAAYGNKPAIQMDQAGNLHLVWVEKDGDFFYALVDKTDLTLEKELFLLHIPLGTGPRLYGPAFGIGDQWGYLLWSVLKQSGLEAGSAKTEYLSFPLHAPEKASQASPIRISSLENPPYQEFTESALGYSHLVPADYAVYSSGYVYDPQVMQGRHDEVAFSLAFNQQYRLDSHVQIAVVVMAEGEYKGYNVATKTQHISSDAVLSADSQGNLHLIWRDGSAGEKLYYTTTSPAIRDRLDRFNIQDLRTLLLVGGVEGIAGILLFPLAFPWGFLGLVLVVAWRLRRNDEDITQRASQFILFFALGVYQISKILIFPTMLGYIPFSAWVDIPQARALPLRIAIPLLIFGAAIALAEYLRRRKSSPPSTLYYYFIVVIIDTVLTLSIYGVNFLGAY